MRNNSFADPLRAPTDRNLRLRQGSVAGPFSFLNPTTAVYDLKQGGQVANPEDPEQPIRAHVQWNARDHRKGRHVLVLSRDSPLATQLKSASSPRKVAEGIWRMFTVFPYWDVSWLVGVFFTFGCLIFIMCGLFYWLPIAFPSTTFKDEDTIAGGVTSFIGATLFQIGAILLFFESVNEQAETKFGEAFGHLFTDHLPGWHHKHDGQSTKTESKSNDGKTEGDESKMTKIDSNDSQSSTGSDKEGTTEKAWRWFPTWHELRTHYIYEVGFLASSFMTIGATIFYVCGTMALPGIYDHLTKPVIYGVYFMTYLVGGVFFVISSVFYILETQPNWYTPQHRKLGWHVGVWNFIGSVGWTLAAALGYCDQHWCTYQSELSLTWASAAFTLGSAIQWYESLEKYVVIIED